MRISIDRDWCKGCGLCIRACKKDVLALGTERSRGDYLMPYPRQPQACIGCRLCERSCPDLCIEVSAE